MVESIGINLPGIDVGWPAAAVIIYANTIGLFYLLFGLILNLVLFGIKWTDTFQPTDIWNYYQFVFWAALVQYVTGSLAWGVACATYLNLIVLLLADWQAPALQEYYGYEGVTCTCFCSINPGPFAILMRVVLKKLHLDGIKLDPTTLREKIGFFGEPVTMGFVIGFIIALIANIKSLGSLSAWSTIVVTAITTGAVMALYPPVSGLFVKGLIPISTTMRLRAQSGQMKRKGFYISMDPAIYFGEEANLASGLLMIPLMLAFTILVPGNRMMPLADIAALPFSMIAITIAFKGNIFGSVLTGFIWYGLGQILNSTILETFTQAAFAADPVSYTGTPLVSSWLLGTIPFGWLAFKAFVAEGGTRYITIAIAIAIYLVVYYFFRKNKEAWQIAAGASPEFIKEQREKLSAIKGEHA
jgi:PTS system galactitol-specific IIC component